MFQFSSLTSFATVIICLCVLQGNGAMKTRSAVNSLFSASQTGPRIINGTEATLSATRHQVSIRRRLNDGFFFGTGHICGGSLISENVVLTAAHCFVDQDIYDGTYLPDTDFIVVMGNLDRFERDNKTLVFDIEKIVYAVEVFNVSTFESDIALVYLNGTVPNNHSTVSPIALTTTAVMAGTVCQVTGWGNTEDGYLSDKLMTVDVPIIDFDVCANKSNYTGTGLLREGMLCAGYAEGERDACGGDSGGPLVCHNLQAGIVSWGTGCALPLLPGVYTNVSYYYPWIRKQMGDGAATVNCSGIFLSLLLLLATFGQRLLLQ